VPDHELTTVVIDIDGQKKLKSNLTQYIFAHNDFRKHYNNMLGINKITSKTMMLLKSLEEQDDLPHTNHVVPLEKKFFPSGIFFSNNDYYVGVVGNDEIVIIDSRKGKVSYRQELPNDETQT